MFVAVAQPGLANAVIMSWRMDLLLFRGKTPADHFSCTLRASSRPGQAKFLGHSLAVSFVNVPRCF